MDSIGTHRQGICVCAAAVRSFAGVEGRFQVNYAQFRALFFLAIADVARIH